MRRKWLHRVEVPRRDALIVLIIDNRTERIDVVRLPLINVAMNARLHLVGHVRPAPFILRHQPNDLSYLDNVRVHVGIEKETLVG